MIFVFGWYFNQNFIKFLKENFSRIHKIFRIENLFYLAHKIDGLFTHFVN